MPGRTATMSVLGGIFAMGAVVTAANIAVTKPLNDWVTWGHFVFPLAFLVTDIVNRLQGAAAARRVVLGGFLLAVAASLALAPTRIAIASGLAFLVGQLVDVAVFDRLRNMAWWRGPSVSSSIAAVVDTGIFYAVAFAGTGDPWLQWGAVDLGVKLVMILPLLAPFRLLTRHWRAAT